MIVRPAKRPEVKTVIIVHDYGNVRGGQEKVAVESALGLAAAGLEMVFFCACAPVDPRLAAAGVRVVCLGIDDLKAGGGKAALRGLWNPDSARRLAAVLTEYDPASTVVHVHGWTKALSASIGPVVTAPGRRHVYTMHEYFLACPNGGFYDYPKGEICRHKAMGAACLLSNCDQRSRVHKGFRLMRQAVALTAGALPRGLRDVISISGLQREVMAPYLSSATRVHAVSNPISIAPGPRVEAEKNAYFVFVGRLEPVKGALDFARAAAAAGIPARFVGDGVDREQVHQIYPDAEITGWVTGDDVTRHLRAARCLAFPSHWYECQPLVPYEALAQGIPVITYDSNAAREPVKSGVNGEIVSFARRNLELPEALEKLRDDATVLSLSKGAHTQYWQDPLTLERHVAALISIYANLGV